MKKSDGGIDECYNGQLAVDSDNQIITAHDLTNQASDSYLFSSIYERIEKVIKEKPKEVSADAGYYSGITYKYIEDKNIDAYLPESRFEKEAKEGKRKYDRSNFTYQKDKNEYVCPEGRKLSLAFSSKRNGIKYKTYKSKDCKDCIERSECISTPTAPNRLILIYENDEFKKEMRKKLLSEEGRKKYKIRLKTVEPVFAQIKYIMGFDRFLLRGLEKAKTEFSLVCTAYNIKKIANNLNPIQG
jgi:hypothetical protein